MDIEKLKMKRRALKSSTTKFLTSLDKNFDDLTIYELETSLEQLSEKMLNIKLINEDIIKVLDVKDIEKEVESSETYVEDLINYKCKIKQKIQQISATPATSSNLNGVTSSQTVNQTEVNKCTIKLPKLTVNKYFGDPNSWLEFIGQFENSIDKNPYLSNIEKLIYLKSFVGGAASKAISGFSLTDDNYKAALNLLKDRFGQKNLLINAHLGQLLNITPIKHNSDTFGLRKLFDRVEIEIRNLESLGIDSASYGNLLTPIILKVLPSEITLDFSRKEKGDNWDLKALLKFLSEEIKSREKTTAITNIKCSNNQKEDKFRSRPHPQKEITSAHELCATAKRINKCVFCERDHDPENCNTLTVEERKNILIKQRLCFLCLKPNHRLIDCYSKKKCVFCNRRHSKAICFKLEENKQTKAFNNKENSKENLEIVSAISSCENKLKHKQNSNPILYLYKI